MIWNISAFSFLKTNRPMIFTSSTWPVKCVNVDINGLQNGVHIAVCKRLVCGCVCACACSCMCECGYMRAARGLHIASSITNFTLSRSLFAGWPISRQLPWWLNSEGSGFGCLAPPCTTLSYLSLPPPHCSSPFLSSPLSLLLHSTVSVRSEPSVISLSLFPPCLSAHMFAHHFPCTS